MTDMERMHRLLKVAETDKNYLTWKYSCDEFEKKYCAMAKWLPKKFRKTFSDYASCCAMAQQRMLNIACKNMKFLDEED